MNPIATPPVDRLQINVVTIMNSLEASNPLVVDYWPSSSAARSPILVRLGLAA
jgi:hypothetical protein